MSKVSKSLISIVVVAAIILLMPFGFSRITQHNYQGMLARVNNRLAPSGISFSLANYQHGWYTSHAALTMTFDPKKVRRGGPTRLLPYSKPITFNVDQTIYNGPIVIDPNYGLTLAMAVISSRIVPSQQTLKTTDITPDENLLTAVTVLHYTLSTDTTVTSIPRKITIDKTDTLDWHGMNATVNMGRHSRHVSIQIVMNGLDGKSKTETLHVGKLNYQADFSELSDDVLLNNQSMLNFEGIRFEQNGKTLFNMTPLVMQSKASEKNGLIAGNANIKLPEISLLAMQFGSGELNFNMENVDAKSLALIRQYNEQVASASGKVRIQRITELLTNLLSKGIKVHLALSGLKTPWGGVSAVVQASIDPIESLNKSILHLLGGLSVKIHVTASKGVVHIVVENYLDRQEKPYPAHAAKTPSKEAMDKQIDSQIAEWVKSGMLMPQGDGYTCEVTYDHGTLALNGKPFPVRLNFDLDSTSPKPKALPAKPISKNAK